MHPLVLLSVIVACATANPLEQVVSVSQDTIGNYNLKLAVDGISRAEIGDSNGNVAGGFAYIDPHGILRKMVFTSGVHGFSPISSDIPLPVQDTPEVALAKAEHLSILRAESTRPLIPEFQDGIHHVTLDNIPLLRSSKFVTVPVQVGVIPDTQEVVAARAQHLAAHAIARTNHLLSV